MTSALQPEAVLLDFGGVLVDVVHRPLGLAEVTREVHELLRQSRANSLAADRIERDVRAGWQAYDDWKRAQNRRAEPREIAHREFWEEFVCADWPAPAREVVAAHATRLCERIDVATKDRPRREGALELLAGLRELRLRTAVVSNALAGSASRALVRDHGFAELLDAQVYSDEVAMRKPNPGIFRRAAELLGVELQRCWYVGDTLDRDVLGGRRAGVGCVLLLPSRETDRGIDVVAHADQVIERPTDILRLLREASG